MRRARSTPRVTVVEATRDAQLFADVYGAPSWDGWRTLLRVLEGLAPEGDEDVRVFRECTGRTAWPQAPTREAWLACGRRAGKSRIAALLAVYEAAFRKHRLSPGERGTVIVLAADRRQARVIFGYVRALLAHPMLAPLLVQERAESLDLRGGITIEVGTASFRSVRGYTLLAAICDEVAFWRSDESANPDVEIVNALRPGLSTTGGLLLGLSSPYARRGVLWRAHERHHGRDGSPVLFWRAPSLMMNPTLPPGVVEEAMAEDAPAARSEWYAEFRSDLETYVDRERLEACVVPGRGELPPRGSVAYLGFADPSGGKGDSFTLAIAHREGERAVVDVLREVKPPFGPDAVVGEFAALCRRYGLSHVVGDKYAAAWVEERWLAHGVRYERAALPKSDLYAALLPQLNAGRVELPDAPRLVNQLLALERRTSRGTGRDSIDHAPGGHDDLANVVAGAVHLTVGIRRRTATTFSIGDLARGRVGVPAYVPDDWVEWWRARG